VDCVYICTAKKRTTKLYGLSPEELQMNMKSNLQSLKAIIRNRQILKSAIAASNERTEVVIGGEKMTVLEAIERKAFLTTYKRIISKLKTQYLTASSEWDRSENLFQAGLEKYINSAVGSSATIAPELIQTLTESYKSLNEMIMIDPCNLSSVIAEMEKYVNDFSTEVDYALSESNAITLIEVDLAG
jgi:uncharacterized protein (DUF302 family)